MHLGLQLCRPHTCQHCGTEVTEFATYGLSCRNSTGRHFHHAALNDIIDRALSTAHIPSRLEPSGLARDGIIIALWKYGQLLVWDATCPDTYMLDLMRNYCSCRSRGSSQPRGTQKKNKKKYAYLGPGHTPIAIESSGVFGTEAIKFLKDLSHHLKLASGEKVLLIN